jgi:predicted restriction endonuclease
MTAVNNGILLCPRHHTLVHEGGFTIRGDITDGLTFHRADGTAI